MPAALARSAIALADGLGGLDVAGALEALATFFCTVDAEASTLRARGVEDLRVDVLRRAMHGQARHAELADLGMRVLTARRWRRSFL